MYLVIKRLDVLVGGWAPDEFLILVFWVGVTNFIMHIKNNQAG
jgi:hypothetical protein